MRSGRPHPRSRTPSSQAIDDAGDGLWDWLTEPPPGAVASDEYSALTSLTMAADLARLLRQREKS